MLAESMLMHGLATVGGTHVVVASLTREVRVGGSHSFPSNQLALRPGLDFPLEPRSAMPSQKQRPAPQNVELAHGPHVGAVPGEMGASF